MTIKSDTYSRPKSDVLNRWRPAFPAADWRLNYHLFRLLVLVVVLRTAVAVLPIVKHRAADELNYWNEQVIERAFPRGR